MKTVVAIHTAMPMVEPTRELFARHLPGVRLINIVDDSLIQDVIGAGKVPAAVELRLNQYYNSAINAGADVIFNYLLLRRRICPKIQKEPKNSPGED